MMNNFFRKQLSVALLFVFVIALAFTSFVGCKSVPSTVASASEPAKVDNFTWDNALVYFVLTDRFYDGDPSNNNSYYRVKNAKGHENATFHGGDIKGLTEKLDYLEDLGVNAIWITAPYEQIHGWVSGVADAFPHYPFHGYYPLDWTCMDKNMGTVEEFRTFVDTAHEKGIRIVMDVVMNHTGYNAVEDMVEYGFGDFKDGKNPGHGWLEKNPATGTWNYNHEITDYNSEKWADWWGPWVRAFDGKFGCEKERGGNFWSCLAGLPDVVTERTKPVEIPVFLKNKWKKETAETGFGPWIVPAAAQYRDDNLGAPADYIIMWLSAWVREFGIDGFRCDTAKHVEVDRWGDLKVACLKALEEWRADETRSPNSPAKKWDEKFWTTGEAFGLTLMLNSPYFSKGGFDSMINFQFNGKSGSTGTTPKVIHWQQYADKINIPENPNNVLTYFSSHDTGLHRPSNLYNAATMLVLLPGGVQIFYGDETAREKAYTLDRDLDMMTRGDMNWDAVDNDLNKHWKKLGKFRNAHPAVGAGQQVKIEENIFARTYTNEKLTDTVIIAVYQKGDVELSVKGYFKNNTTVRNAYTGDTAVVKGGKVTFNAGNQGLILLEEVK